MNLIHGFGKYNFFGGYRVPLGGSGGTRPPPGWPLWPLSPKAPLEIFLKPLKTFHSNPEKVPRPLVALALAKNLDTAGPWCVVLLKTTRVNIITDGGLFFYRLRFGERTEVRQHTTVKILPLVSTTVSSLTRSSPLTTSQTTQATTTKTTTTTTQTTPSTTATTPVPQPTTTASRPRVKFVVTQTRTSTRVTQVPTTTAPVTTATSQRTTVPTPTATTTTAKSTATSTKRTTSDTARSTTTPKPTVQV